MRVDIGVGQRPPRQLEARPYSSRVRPLLAESPVSRRRRVITVGFVSVVIAASASVMARPKSDLVVAPALHVGGVRVVLDSGCYLPGDTAKFVVSNSPDSYIFDLAFVDLRRGGRWYRHSRIAVGHGDRPSSVRPFRLRSEDVGTMESLLEVTQVFTAQLPRSLHNGSYRLVVRSSDVDGYAAFAVRDTCASRRTPLTSARPATTTTISS